MDKGNAAALPLVGKRIIVTGAATGMGAASVIAYARAGADVVGWYRHRQPDGLLESLTESQRARVHFARHDVAEASQVEQGMAAAAQQLGGIDVLVHAAGIIASTPAQDIRLEDWGAIMRVNATGTFLTNTAVFPYLKQRGGKILNFASAAGVNGLYGKAHYSASKGAVLAWTRCVAKEWAAFNITVNAIAPAIWTPMYDSTRAEMGADELAHHDAMMKLAIPLGGKLGDPEKDFAPMMVFLAGDGAGFLTGQTYAIDGGALMLT